VYPYVIGPTYYGKVATDNFAVRGPNASPTAVTINESVQTYVPKTNESTVTITSTAVLTGKEGVPYTYTVTAENSVKAAMVFGLLSGPQGMTIDSVRGLLTWASPVVGTHSVSIGATIVVDGKPYAAKQTYSLVILSNAPLTINFLSTPVLVGYEGTPYSYRVRVRASDTTRQVMLGLGDGAPQGMTLAMRTLGWQAPVKGTYQLTINATVQGDTVTVQQSFTLEIKADTTTSVDEERALSSITIYPNPAADMLVVQVTDPMTVSATVELVDLHGRIMRQAIINQGSTMCFLDVQTLYAGSYFARITRAGSSIHLPVVIGD
jgi:hypothetical protein